MLRLSSNKRGRSPTPSLPQPFSLSERSPMRVPRLNAHVRRALLALAALGTILLLVRELSSKGKPRRIPRWTSLRKYERELPQQNLDLPHPEGQSGRYVRFTNQMRGLGWNNVLNEM
jgi:hypothetical protein